MEKDEYGSLEDCYRQTVGEEATAALDDAFLLPGHEAGHRKSGRRPVKK